MKSRKYKLKLRFEIDILVFILAVDLFISNTKDSTLLSAALKTAMQLGIAIILVLITSNYTISRRRDDMPKTR